MIEECVVPPIGVVLNAVARGGETTIEELSGISPWRCLLLHAGPKRMTLSEANAIELMGVRMDPITMQDSIDRIDHRIASRIFTQHVVLNVAKLVHLRSDPALRHSVEECDIINIDGMGLVWGARLLGHKVPERVTGIDLFEALVLLAERRNYPIFLLGAEPDVVRTTRDRLMARHPHLVIAGIHSGYFRGHEEEVVRLIAASGARLLFVAMPSPTKENFIAQWKEQLGVDFVMGVGGTFDVVAGKTRRAPQWMQRFGLEWLYRLLQEPRRMWRRYLVTNSVFAGLLIVEFVRGRRALADGGNNA